MKRIMASPSSSEPRAAGAAIALLALAGAIGGTFYGQPTIGLLAGLGLGIAIAIAFWLVDRQRGS